MSSFLRRQESSQIIPHYLIGLDTSLRWYDEVAARCVLECTIPPRHYSARSSAFCTVATHSHPQQPSAFVAELYRWWYRRRAQRSSGFIGVDPDYYPVDLRTAAGFHHDLVRPPPAPLMVEELDEFSAGWPDTGKDGGITYRHASGSGVS